MSIGNGGSGTNNNSNGAGDAGNGAGDTRDGDDPNNAGDDTDLIAKIVFTYRMTGGPVAAWGMTGRFPVVSVAHMQNRLVVARSRLIRAMIVDEVTQLILDVYGHNSRGRVRTVLNSMNLLMLRAPGQMDHIRNYAELYDTIETTRDVEVRLLHFVRHARTLPDYELPLEVPLLFFSGRLKVHPYCIQGSFDWVCEENPDGTTRLPHGMDHGVQILEPVAIAIPPLPPPQPPVPAPGNAGNAAGNAGNAAPQLNPHADSITVHWMLYER